MRRVWRRSGSGGDHCNEIAAPLLRRAVDNYMVHVNKYDGSRYFIPYAGGFDKYVKKVEEVVSDDYRGFVFTKGLSTGNPGQTVIEGRSRDAVLTAK